MDRSSVSSTFQTRSPEAAGSSTEIPRRSTIVEAHPRSSTCARGASHERAARAVACRDRAARPGAIASVHDALDFFAISPDPPTRRSRNRVVARTPARVGRGLQAHRAIPTISGGDACGRWSHGLESPGYQAVIDRFQPRRHPLHAILARRSARHLAGEDQALGSPRDGDHGLRDPPGVGSPRNGPLLRPPPSPCGRSWSTHGLCPPGADRRHRRADRPPLRRADPGRRGEKPPGARSRSVTDSPCSSWGRIRVGPLEGMLEVVLELPKTRQALVIAGRNEQLRVRVTERIRGHERGSRSTASRIAWISSWPPRIHRREVRRAHLERGHGSVGCRCRSGRSQAAEERNCDFLQESGAGVRVHDLDELHYRLHHFIANPEHVEWMRWRARAIGRPQSAFDVA